MSQLTFFIDNLCIFAIRKFNCMQLYDEKTSSCQNDEFQDSFVASIVHDLKNLMVPIMSRSELLLMPNISEEKKQNMVKQLNASCYTQHPHRCASHRTRTTCNDDSLHEN